MIEISAPLPLGQYIAPPQCGAELLMNAYAVSNCDISPGEYCHSTTFVVTKHCTTNTEYRATHILSSIILISAE